MEERVVYIYALEFPRGEIRYIGKSYNPEERFKSHIRDSIKSTRSHKMAWIRSLLNEGKEPYLEILGEVPESEWEYWERYCIEEAIKLGFNLVNSTPGGDGISNPSEDIREKISNSLKEYFKKNSIWNKGTKGVSSGYPKGKKRTEEDARANSERKKEYYKTHKPWNYGVSSITPNSEYKGREDLKTREIVQFDLEGNFVAEWKSVSVVCHVLGKRRGLIAKCLKGRRTDAYGYIWKYKDEL